jgi:hypothetical protein
MAKCFSQIRFLVKHASQSMFQQQSNVSLSRGESVVSESQKNAIPSTTNIPRALSRPSTPPHSSIALIAPPSVKDFNLPLKPFRIPFLHTKDARSAIVPESEKLKRPSTAGSDISRTLGIRSQVGENRIADTNFAQFSKGFPARPSTALSGSPLSAVSRPKSAGPNPLITSRNRSLSNVELDRIESERKRLDERLISMKGVMNDMSAQSKFMEEELKRLQFQSTILDKDLLDCDADAEHRLVQSLLAIQTKSEYWIQSVKEEELYTNTLTLVLERNSSMRIEVETKFTAEQSQLVHYDHDLHVLSIRLHQAKLEQSSAEKVYQSFAEEIEKWREQRDAQLVARKKQVSDIRKEQNGVEVQGNSVDNSQLIRQGSESDFSNASDAISKRTLQEGMLQMKRLTQQESAASISACYNACIERTQQFIEEEESMKQRIVDCKKQKEVLSKTLELLKYGGDDSDSNADGEIKTRTSKIER